MLIKCIDDTNVNWALEKDKVYKVIRETTECYFIKIFDNETRGFLKYRFKKVKENEGDVEMKIATKTGKYESIATKIGQVVDKKNKQYGDAINNADSILQILYPDGIKVEQYKDISVIVRVLDKLFRLSKGDEGDESAWNDIAGYGILMSKENK